MNKLEVTVVRIYLSESGGQLEPLLAFLHDTARVRGWTVYRGVSGFGESGKVRAASWVDLSLDLPVTIEFFDATDKVAAWLEPLSELAGSGHIVTWPATLLNHEPDHA